MESRLTMPAQCITWHIYVLPVHAKKVFGGYNVQWPILPSSPGFGCHSDTAHHVHPAISNLPLQHIFRQQDHTAATNGRIPAADLSLKFPIRFREATRVPTTVESSIP